VTILNEGGWPDAIPPLAGVFDLADRLPGALFVVAGTRADAHLALSLSDGLPGLTHGAGHPDGHDRVAFVVLEPDEAAEDSELASRIVEAAAGVPRAAGRPEAVFLVACRTARLLGLEAPFEAEVASRRLGVPVMAVDPLPGGPALSTDLEDAVLRSLVGLCPGRTTPPVPEERRKESGLLGNLGGRLRGRPAARAEGALRPVVLIGGLPAARAELSGELARLGVEVAGSVPSPAGFGSALPPVGEGTVVAPLDPYLARACAAAGERGAMVVRTLFPVGVDGTARFLQDVARAAGRSTTSEVLRARQVWEGLEHLRARLRGRRVFFTGGTGMEVPLARFLADAGAVVLEVGVPRLERRFLSEELGALGAGVDVVESPEWRAQLGRIDEARPDVVICNPGLYPSLVARGHLCRTSGDLLLAAPHGYDGARRTLVRLAHTFDRAAELDALNLL
jgi:light-independent protochlorophyllide reductase subunit N